MRAGSECQGLDPLESAEVLRSNAQVRMHFWNFIKFQQILIEACSERHEHIQQRMLKILFCISKAKIVRIT